MTVGKTIKRVALLATLTTAASGAVAAPLMSGPIHALASTCNTMDCPTVSDSWDPGTAASYPYPNGNPAPVTSPGQPSSEGNDPSSGYSVSMCTYGTGLTQAQRYWCQANM